MMTPQSDTNMTSAVDVGGGKRRKWLFQLGTMRLTSVP